MTDGISLLCERLGQGVLQSVGVDMVKSLICAVNGVLVLPGKLRQRYPVSAVREPTQGIYHNPYRDR